MEVITFKQFLSEARTAPLYHGTDLRSAMQIFHEGAFTPSTAHNAWKLQPDKPRPIRLDQKPDDWSQEKLLDYNRKFYDWPSRVYGISTSRNSRYAKKWAKWRNPDEYVVFELDQQKITHRYKIIPVNFFQHTSGMARNPGDISHDNNEFEEFIVSDKKIPISIVKKVYYRVPKSKIINVEMWIKQYPHIEFEHIQGGAKAKI